MSRIAAIDPATTEGKTRSLLDGIQKSLGVTPNLYRVAAQSPAALQGLLGLTGALAGGALSGKVREQISIAVAETNGCDYCLSAHTLLGKGAGLTEQDLSAARDGHASEPKANAAVHFAASLVKSRGHATDAELATLRQAGFSEGEIVEVVTATVLNILTNYLNHVAQTDIDFPVVKSRASAA